MPYLPGPNLSQLILQRGALDPGQAMVIAGQMAAALDYAHQRGLLHRDIKPANVMIDSRGDAILTDFGIAKAMGEGAALTRTGTTMGTPQYMAPEQWTTSKVDERTDLYALGILIYQMLTGQVPFDGETSRVMYGHVNESPPPPGAFNPSLPSGVGSVFLKALAKDPSQRYGTAGQMVADLKAALGGQPVAAAPPSPPAGTPVPVSTQATQAGPLSAPPPAVSTGRGTPWGLVAGIVVVLLIAAIAAAAVFLVLPGERQAKLPSPTAAPSGAGVSQAPTPTVTSTPSPVPPTATTAAAEEPSPSSPESTGETPGLMVPVDGQTVPAGVPITMRWKWGPSLDVAQRYRVALRAQDGTPMDYMTAESEMQVTDLAPSVYTWLVLVEDPRDGMWQEVARSPRWTFTIQAPAPTHTAIPSDTPAPAAAATPAPAAAATPAPAAVDDQRPAGGGQPGLVVGFEQEMNWERGDQPYGSLTRSTDEVKEGSYAGKLSYDFPAVTDNYVVFLARPSVPVAGSPTGLTAWVFGDGSGHFLNTWMKDSGGEVRQYTFGEVTHLGWKKMTARFNEKYGWPNGHVSGTDDGKLSFPVSLYALVLDGVPDGTASSGTIYVDEISAIEGSMAEGPAADATAETGTSPGDTSPSGSGTETGTGAGAGTGTGAATGVGAGIGAGVGGLPISGKLAVPIDSGAGYYDVVIFQLPDGQELGKIDHAGQPNFRPDGILAVNGGKQGVSENVWEYKFDGSGGREISASPNDSHPFWKPDGTGLVYDNPELVCAKTECPEWHIFVQPNSNKPKTRDVADAYILAGDIFRGQPMYPLWAADDYVIFRACDIWPGGSGGTCGIWRTPSWATHSGAGFSSPVKLTSDDEIPTDTKGNRLLFMSSKEGNWEVYVTGITGGPAANLSNDPAGDGLGTISPDGNWVAFASSRDGVWGVWVVPISGGVPQRVPIDIPPWGTGALDWTTERMSWGP
jgi:hypothetical protein